MSPHPSPPRCSFTSNFATSFPHKWHRGDREWLWLVHNSFSATPSSSYASCAPAWGPSHGVQSFVNCSKINPSHRLQFFKNCSILGPFHGMQSCRVLHRPQCGYPLRCSCPWAAEGQPPFPWSPQAAGEYFAPAQGRPPSPAPSLTLLSAGLFVTFFLFLSLTVAAQCFSLF